MQFKYEFLVKRLEIKFFKNIKFGFDNEDNMKMIYNELDKLIKEGYKKNGSEMFENVLNKYVNKLSFKN